MCLMLWGKCQPRPFSVLKLNVYFGEKRRKEVCQFQSLKLFFQETQLQNLEINKIALAHPCLRLCGDWLLKNAVSDIEILSGPCPISLLPTIMSSKTHNTAKYFRQQILKNSRSSLDCDSEGTQEQSCKIFIVALYFFKVQNIEGDRRSKPSFAGLLTKYSKQRNLHQTKTKSTILISHKRGRSPPQVLSFKSCWAGYRYICVWARKIICYKLWFHRWVILVQLF